MNRLAIRLVTTVAAAALPLTGLALTASPATAASAMAATTARQATARPAAALRVGDLTLHRCDLGVGRATYCGHLGVRLEPSAPAGPRLRVGFGWVPASGATPHGPGSTIVAQEGGPGYPSTATAPYFADTFGNLLDTHNLLVVDARGTGRSDAIDCRPLQTQGVTTGNLRFRHAVSACGRQLNRRWRGQLGPHVHASDLFGTAYAVGDLSQLITALGLGKVDLYGDSYGTFLAQSFLSYHPEQLHAEVLDSAYEARGLDAWYLTAVHTARQAFNQVCRRALACSTRGTGTTAWGEIGRLARRLRQHPVSGETTGYHGHRRGITVGVPALVNLVNDAGYDYEAYRMLYAAARAYLTHGDTQPLLRLYAQDVGYDYSDYSSPATSYSDGLFMAVACTDYPQLYSMTAGRTARVRQLKRAIADLPARTFAPFTTREWIRMLPYTETYTGCLSWPRRKPSTLPVIKGGHLDAGDIPVLVLNGDLDSLTPAAGGRHVARELGPSARSITITNLVHLVALYYPYGCGDQLVRRFLRHPGKLDALDASCRRDTPEIHALGDYRSHVGPGLRPQAAMALRAAGDAAHRWEYITGRRDRGLRGGIVR